MFTAYSCPALPPMLGGEMVKTIIVKIFDWEDSELLNNFICHVIIEKEYLNFISTYEENQYSIIRYLGRMNPFKIGTKSHIPQLQLKWEI